MNVSKDRPIIGILCWELGSPRGLQQLEKMPGNVICPRTFDFPVRYERVQGANFHTIVEEPSTDALLAMIKAARGMEKDGIRAITTSCGFNAIFQSELANSVSVPVFTSSLLQVPMVYRMLGRGHWVGIITAQKRFLTDKHLRETGIDRSTPLCIEGLEDTGEWDRIHRRPEEEVDLRKLEKEIVQVGRRIVEKNQKTGAIVLECTDLPPFAKAIQKVTHLPVFDIVTLVRMVHEAFMKKG